MSVTEINSTTEFVKALCDSKNIAVIVFSAKWCGPCKRLAPQMVELADKYEKQNFFKIDVDNKEIRDIVKTCKIEPLPSILFFVNGKYCSRVEGADIKAIEGELKRYIADNADKE